MDGVDDVGVVDALEVGRGDAEVAVAELALDDKERDAFVGHLDGVGVAELVRRETSPDTGERCRRSPLGIPPAVRRHLQSCFCLDAVAGGAPST